MLPQASEATPATFHPAQVRSYPNSELKKYNLAWDDAPFLTADVKAMHKETQYFLNDLAHRKTDKVKKHWLTFCGRSGCGKTHLAKAIVEVARRELGFDKSNAQVWTASRYAEKLRNGDYGVQDWLKSLPLLVLDDLGAEQMSEMFRAKLYDLLNARENKWTVITTNLSMTDIASSIDPRISSRLNRGFNVICRVADARDYFLELKPA